MRTRARTVRLCGVAAAALLTFAACRSSTNTAGASMSDAGSDAPVDAIADAPRAASDDAAIDADARAPLDAHLADAYIGPDFDAPPCSTAAFSDAGLLDVDNGEASATYPAFPPDAPQVVDSGGPVIANPIVVPVFFSDFAYESDLTDLVSVIGASDYWSTVTSEYGIGAITAGTTIDFGAPAPAAAMEQMPALVASLFDGTHPDIGDPDPNTIYTFFFPASAVITAGGSPVGEVGYHGSTVLTTSSGPVTLIFAVIAARGSAANAWTDVASHEWIEASTDPEVDTNPAYASVDDDHFAWLEPSTATAPRAGELADLCNEPYLLPGTSHVVVRAWSNAQAAAGHDPCVPAQDHPYFTVVPVVSKAVKYFDSTMDAYVMRNGIDVPAQGEAIVELDLVSDAMTNGPWNLAVDCSALGFDCALSANTGSNGEKVYLRLKENSCTPGDGTNVATLPIASTLGGAEHDAYLLVGY